MKNQQGQITVDFIFAIVLVLGFTSLLFVLSFTLSVASITQYITYASARNFMLGNIDLAAQTAQGQAKYQELISNPVFKPLYSNGWYKVDAEAFLGDATTVFPGYVAATQGINQFWGAGTHFQATILDFQIPFFGSTVTDSNGKGTPFNTFVGSYLGREPTEDECIQLTNARWSAIRNLQVSGGAAYSTGTSDSGQEYIPTTDDGC